MLAMYGGCSCKESPFLHFVHYPGHVKESVVYKLIRVAHEGISRNLSQGLVKLVSYTEMNPGLLENALIQE